MITSKRRLMIIRCWGARGSIPVSGEHYLRYGGNTTCLEIRNSQNDVLLVDAGSGIREAGNALLDEGLSDFTLILTHAHWDHIMGFPFFKPIYRPDTCVTVWGCSFAQDTLKDMIRRVMSAPYFPINYEEVRTQITYQDVCWGSYRFGEMTIEPVALSHPNQGMGYKFTEGNKSFVFLTDNELGLKHQGGLDYSDYLAFCRNADLLMHDAEYRDGEYAQKQGWGHSTIEQATSLAIDAGVRRLGLFHHNQDRIDQDVDDMVDDCRKIASEKKSNLDCFAAHQGLELIL